MYSIDEHDRVVQLADIPVAETGDSAPIVIANEHRLLLAYKIFQDIDWSLGSEALMDMGWGSGEQPYAIVHFRRFHSYSFGSPNDETRHGHPLHERGLRAYGAQEVLHSSWIRALERMNSVHPRHQPERFADLHHYVFAFHESMFECVADGFSVSIVEESMRERMSMIAGSLVV